MDIYEKIETLKRGRYGIHYVRAEMMLFFAMRVDLVNRDVREFAKRYASACSILRNGARS